MITILIIQLIASLIIVIGILYFYYGIKKKLEDVDRKIAYWKGLFQETKKERDQLIRKNNVVIKTINKDTL